MKVLPLCPVAELLIFFWGDPMLEPGNTNHVIIYIYVYRMYINDIYIYVYISYVYIHMISYRRVL